MEGLYSFLVLLDGFLGGAGWFPYVLLGVGLFLKVETIRNTKGTFIRMMGEGPDRFFDTFISGLIRVSARFTRLV